MIQNQNIQGFVPLDISDFNHKLKESLLIKHYQTFLKEKPWKNQARVFQIELGGRGTPLPNLPKLKKEWKSDKD